MASPTDRRYSKEHVWAKKDKDSDKATFGLTEYNISKRGGITSISNLAPKKTSLGRGDSMGTINGSTSNADFPAPMGGVVTDREEHLLDMPEVNEDPYADGSWFITIGEAKQSEYD